LFLSYSHFSSIPSVLEVCARRWVSMLLALVDFAIQPILQIHEDAASSHALSILKVQRMTSHPLVHQMVLRHRSLLLLLRLERAPLFTFKRIHLDLIHWRRQIS